MTKYKIEDGTQLDEAVGVAIGAASTCWETLDTAGVFDSTRAGEIAEELIAAIRDGRVRDGQATVKVSRWVPIAEAIRSFDWGNYAANSSLEEGLRGLEGDRFVEPLARHIRERMQGSRWQPLDVNGSGGAAFIAPRTPGPDLGDDPDGDIEGYDGP
jgi:hypothetical protein